MKPMLKIKYAICILICLTALHFNGYSQGAGTHLTMSLQNCTMPTANTIQFDLMVVSDGDNVLPVYSNSFQYGVNFNPAIMQPGCTALTFSYVNGTSELLYTSPQQTFNFPAADSINH